MFVGHYSVAFACRTERNKIPLWVLFFAVQFLDYIWATLVLLGIEKLRVIKGFTAGSMLDSYFHPYSHSLIAAVQPEQFEQWTMDVSNKKMSHDEFGNLFRLAGDSREKLSG